MKLKAMEQVYLQRIESSQAEAVTKKSVTKTHGGTSTTQSIPKKQRSPPKKPPAFREF